MTKYCPKCGAPNPDDALYCSKCGSTLPAAKPPEAAAQPPAPVAPSESKPAPGRRSRAWLWLVIGLVIGLVAAGVPLTLNYNSLQGQYQALNASYWNLQSSYTSLQNQYSSLQSSYNSLHSQYQDLQSAQSSLASNYLNLIGRYQALNASYNSLQSSYNFLQSVANLQQTTTWVNAQTVSEGPGGDYYWSFSAPYAGYVTVTVSSSTTSNTWIEISGVSSNGIGYDTGEIPIVSGGIISYPVLPGTVYVEVGNNNLANGATETVAITYTY